MAVSPSRSGPGPDPSRRLASQFGVAAVCLLALYGVVVLTAILPPRLTDPAWQLKFSGALVNNGFLALLGLALINLAAHLHPGDRLLSRRRDDFARWALVPVLGFLLLVPLQIYGAWQGIRTANSQQSRQLDGVTGRISALREAIGAATSTQELQQRLLALKVPPLTAPDLAQPLPQLRKALLASLEQTEIRAQDRFSGIRPEQLWLVVQASIRSILSALVLAIGFSAFARRNGREQTLLQHWQERWRNLLQRRRGSSSPSSSRHPNARPAGKT